MPEKTTLRELLSQTLPERAAPDDTRHGDWIGHLWTAQKALGLDGTLDLDTMRIGQVDGPKGLFTLPAVWRLPELGRVEFHVDPNKELVINIVPSQSRHEATIKRMLDEVLDTPFDL